MATLPTAEESARLILDGYLRHNCRPGYVLSQRDFLLSGFLQPPFQPSDIVQGLRYAAAQGWIEIVDSDKFKLTESGFSKAGEEDDVNLFSLCNETVTVERSTDGSRRENVSALVSSDHIVIPDVSVPLAPDDVILRKLPSGDVERFVVTEPGFHEKFHGIPAHYQAKYRREGTAPEGQPGYVVNVSGQNSRVNINSTDNSTNVVHYQPQQMVQLAEELLTLREELLQRARSSEDYVAIGAVSQAEIAANAGDSTKLGKVLSTLGAGGRWVLDVAEEISVKLAVEAVKAHMGLPPG